MLKREIEFVGRPNNKIGAGDEVVIGRKVREVGTEVGVGRVV